MKKVIQKELESNLIFKEIFNKFEIPKLTELDKELDKELDLVYKSNEYMGYYKKEIYFDLIPKIENLECVATLKLTFSSNVKKFDIQKAMHLIPTNEIHNISVTFMIYNDGNDWDTARYNYTLWKNKNKNK